MKPCGSHGQECSPSGTLGYMRVVFFLLQTFERVVLRSSNEAGGSKSLRLCPPGLWGVQAGEDIVSY